MLDVAEFLFDYCDGRVNFEFTRGTGSLVGASFTGFGLACRGGLNTGAVLVGVVGDLVLHIIKNYKDDFPIIS